MAVSCPGNDTVVVFDADGTELFTYSGKGPGKLNGPAGVAFDPYGRILISDNFNHRICVVSSQGHHIQNIPLDQDGTAGTTGNSRQ